MELDTVGASPSTDCRPGQDCWDVRFEFFDPEKTRRSRRIYRYTIDVSDPIPVTVGEIRHWISP